MATHCFIPLRGKRMRITQLDRCGRYPVDGTPDAFVVTKGFISVSLSSEVEDGNEILQRNANGDICINERTNSSFKRLTVEMEFCGVNPSLLAMVSNAEPYRDYAGDVAGITISEGEMDKAFALELWTGMSGQSCDAGADEASGYILLPYVQGGVLGDISIDGENAVTFSLTGAFTKGGNAWGVGPYDVVYNGAGVASKLPTALDPKTHFLLTDTGLALPPDQCDPQPMVQGGGGTATTTTSTSVVVGTTSTTTTQAGGSTTTTTTQAGGTTTTSTTLGGTVNIDTGIV